MFGTFVGTSLLFGGMESMEFMFGIPVFVSMEPMYGFVG